MSVRAFKHTDENFQLLIETKLLVLVRMTVVAVKAEFELDNALECSLYISWLIKYLKNPIFVNFIWSYFLISEMD